MTQIAPGARPEKVSRYRGFFAPRAAGQYPLALTLSLISPLFVLLVLGFLYPIAYLIKLSLFGPQLDFSNYQRIIDEPLYLEVILRTLRIAFLVMVACLLLGYPIAYAMARLRGVLAVVASACVLFALWSPILVRSYAWIVLLQRNGVVNSLFKQAGITETSLRMLYTETAVIVAMVHVLMPFMILPIFAALRLIPCDYVRAALNLGASPTAAFARVTLPLSLPGISAGCAMTFILALGFYVTPALVGGPGTMMAATLIGQQVTVLMDWPFAAALATLLLGLTLLLVFVFRRALSANGGFHGVN